MGYGRRDARGEHARFAAEDNARQFGQEVAHDLARELQRRLDRGGGRVISTRLF